MNLAEALCNHSEYQLDCYTRVKSIADVSQHWNTFLGRLAPEVSRPQYKQKIQIGVSVAERANWI